MGKLYFTCSFDDGDAGDFRLAALMEKYGVKGTFYIPRSCDLVNKSLTDAQIRDLSEIVEIGGHTLTHQVLTHTSPEKAKAEIRDCKRWLEDVTGKAIHSFCPPTGRFSSRHIDDQVEAGYTSTRTVEMIRHSFRQVTVKQGITILPTTSQVFNHARSAYVRNITKRFNLSLYPVLFRYYRPGWEQMSSGYLNSLRTVANASDHDCFFHLWGHSWEIERYQLWDGIERFFQLASAMPDITYCDNTNLAALIKKDINNDR